MTVVQGITPDMAPPAAVGRAGVTAPVPGMIIVRITARVCAWVVDRTASSTGISIVTGRADRVTAAVARGMRQGLRLVNQVTRVNTRATRVVVRVTAAVASRVVLLTIARVAASELHPRPGIIQTMLE
jgi:hypothetical protein